MDMLCPMKKAIKLLALIKTPNIITFKQHWLSDIYFDVCEVIFKKINY